MFYARNSTAYLKSIPKDSKMCKIQTRQKTNKQTKKQPLFMPEVPQHDASLDFMLTMFGIQEDKTVFFCHGESMK